MPTIALIAPTPIESKEIRREIHPSPADELKIISDGELHGKSIVFTHCGVGKVNAAHSATLVLENYFADIIILFGIAGAYDAKVGDVVVAETENYGDEGVLTKEGWKSMELTGFPMVKNGREYYNTFPMDTELMQRAVKASKDLGLNIITGNFVTVSQSSGTREMGDVLKKRFNGLCENMEGAAVAHICALYKTPLLEVRGISNIVENRDLKKWNIPLAVSHCNKVVSEVVRKL